MRLANAAHTSMPWRVHEFTGDFVLEDVWAISTPGAAPEGLPAMLAAMSVSGGDSPLLRLMFAVRRRVGALLGWDGPAAGIGARVPSLRDRLPSDLRRAPHGSDTGMAPFTTVYALDDECALELANQTAHMVMHLGWAPVAGGGHELRMAILARRNGLLGRLYLAAITPFRWLLVLPAFTRQLERAWRRRDTDLPGSAAAPGDIPESVRALSSLPVIDYADRFTRVTDAEATPEQWARAMFGDTPDAAARLIFRGFLGLRLAPGRSPDTVAGWRIAARGGDWIRLEAASWFVTGNLVVQAAEGRVSLSTLLRYDRRLGYGVWTPLSAIHRRLAPGLLRDAETRLTRDASGQRANR
ncbi:DUF2867 domain-containing protein [Nonomuraea indica]|uniref:DUF2867 domain-containing protein n=1 Tax=Nonomuraea indica TaxID=1581193 RepID=UPI000C7CA2F2|nr:DUF2867 domain-containing protein [Nonomuraea indica]